MAKKEDAAKVAPEINEETVGLTYVQLYEKAVQLESALKKANSKLAAVINVINL